MINIKNLAILSIFIMFINCNLNQKLERNYKNHEFNEIIAKCEELMSKEETQPELEKTFVPFIISKDNKELNSALEQFLKNNFYTIGGWEKVDGYNKLLKSLMNNKFKFMDPEWLISGLLEQNTISQSYQYYLNYFNDDLVVKVLQRKVNWLFSNNKYYEAMYHINTANRSSNSDFNLIKNISWNYNTALNNKYHPGEFLSKAQSDLTDARGKLAELEVRVVIPEPKVTGIFISARNENLQAGDIYNITINLHGQLITFKTFEKSYYDRVKGDVITVYLKNTFNIYWGSSESENEDYFKQLNEAKEKYRIAEENMNKLKSRNLDEELAQAKNNFELTMNELTKKYNN